MGSDDDINLTLFELLYRLFLLCCTSETAHQIHVHRKILHPLRKSIVDLLRQNGCRGKICHLLAVLHRLEGRTDCNLRLAVAHITANQSVHYFMALHISLCGFYCKNLILSLIKWEKLLKLSLPHSILAEGIAVLLLTLGIQLHQISCNLLYCTSDPVLCPGPFLTAKLVELWFSGILSGIFLYHIKLGGKNIEIGAPLILYLDVVLYLFVHLKLFNAAVNAESVVFMHHIVPHRQIGKALYFLTLIGAVTLLFLLLRPKNIRLRNHGKL